MLSARQELLGALTIRLPPPVDRQLELLGAVEPEALVRAARSEGVAGLLWGNARRAGWHRSIAAPQAGELEALYRRTAALNMQKQADLRDLAPRLDAAGIEVIVLKGLALLDDLYPDPGLRATGDIDLRVDARQRATLISILAAERFRAQPFYPDTLRRGNTAIDIHTHLLGIERIRSRAAILAAGEAPMLEGSRPTSYGEPIARLNPPREALLLVLHLLKHNADRLLWLIEINERVAGLEPEQWDELVRLCDSMAQAKSLAHMAYLADTLLPHTVTHRLRQLAADHPPARIARHALRRRVSHGAMPSWAPLLFFCARRDAGARAAAILETLFPRPTILRQVFADADAGLLRLYARRIGQLIGMVFR